MEIQRQVEQGGRERFWSSKVGSEEQQQGRELRGGTARRTKEEQQRRWQEETEAQALWWVTEGDRAGRSCITRSSR